MNPNRFFTDSLNPQYNWTHNIIPILVAALEAVEPEKAVNSYLNRQENLLTVGNIQYNLQNYHRVFLIGVGKAGIPMSRAAAEVLGDNLTEGIIIIKDEPNCRITRCQILMGGHPIPNLNSIQATQKISQLLEKTTEKDLVLVLISGGASALMSQPEISLSDLQKLTEILLACGANINEINTLRKHFDRLKGGGLARLAIPATIVTLILSDVVGNSLDAIASGPTVPDSTTFADAWEILLRYNLVNIVPKSVKNRLEQGIKRKIPETPKEGNLIFNKVQNLLIGSNLQAAEAALKMAKTQGFINTLLLTTYAQGEARELGRFLAGIARQIVATKQPISPPACLIIGGETTVKLCQNPGKGGRNQEIALGAVRDIAGLANVVLITLATDGGDGITDAAGAVVTGETFEKAQRLNLNLDEALYNNNAYSFFDSLNDLLKIGATETNVNDLAFLFVG